MDQFDEGREENARSEDAIRRLDELLRMLRDVTDVFPAHHRDMERPLAHVSWTGARVRSEPLEIGFGHAQRARSQIKSLHHELERIAKVVNVPWTATSVCTENDEACQTNLPTSLGRLVLRHERRKFLRGFVECRENRAIAPALPERLLHYLVMAVPGIREQLDRETHGHWGIHYHYIDANERRSDTLLTFDQQSRIQAMPTLCWERHSKGKFAAKAQQWGTKKRESIYSVCLSDTKRWPLTAFKRPGRDAVALWPRP